MEFAGNLLHSVSYAGLWGQATLGLDAFIDKAADLGYDGVLLMAKRPHLSVLDYDTEACTRLRRKIESRGLRHVGLAGYTNFTADLEHGEVPHREIQIQHVTELARMARDLGAKVVRIYTGYDHPGASFAAQWNMVVAALRECARRIAPWGVTIGIQNHHDIAAGYELQHDLIRAVGEPNCLAMFDAWSVFLHGADLAAAARKMGPITAHTTIADYQLRPRYKYDANMVNYTPATPLVQAVPMGEGAIDYRAFLGALHQGGFRGTVAYEMCSPLIDGNSMETLDDYGRRFVAYMKGLRGLSAAG
jgi:sugar phosphate isomerase/epimerase